MDPRIEAHHVIIFGQQSETWIIVSQHTISKGRHEGSSLPQAVYLGLVPRSVSFWSITKRELITGQRLTPEASPVIENRRCVIT